MITYILHVYILKTTMQCNVTM